jgi:hypothetical protein
MSVADILQRSDELCLGHLGPILDVVLLGELVKLVACIVLHF